MKVFLRLTAILLIFVLIVPEAVANECYWFCYSCRAYRDTQYCPDCGARRPHSAHDDDNIHVEYDLPVNTGDDSLGEMAFEVFIRTMQILNDGYILIAKALYLNNDDPRSATTPDSEAKDLLKLLKDSHDEINIKISKAASTENREN